MDLWYDLAVRELENLDAHVAELIQEEKAKTPARLGDAPHDCLVRPYLNGLR
jgi:hypothetical protein